jgi:hypothetical protein
MLITALTNAATCSYPDPKYQSTSEVFCVTIRNKIRVYGKELLAPRPAPKVEDNHLSAVRDCLFNLFTVTLHIGGRSSIHNLRTRQAMVRGTHSVGKFVLPQTQFRRFG